jgi:hypothetical protein
LKIIFLHGEMFEFSLCFFCLKILLNVKWQGHNMTHHPLIMVHTLHTPSSDLQGAWEIPAHIIIIIIIIIMHHFFWVGSWFLWLFLAHVGKTLFLSYCICWLCPWWGEGKDCIHVRIWDGIEFWLLLGTNLWMTAEDLAGCNLEAHGMH